MTLLHQVVQIALPAITFFLITMVGMDTTVQDFREVMRNSKAAIVGMLGQYILPLIALGLLKPLHMRPELAAGLVVIACAPAGGISNVYTYLARASTALSVTLTALSCTVAGITMPLLLRLFEHVHGLHADFDIPARTLFAQLILFLIIPVFIGVWIRRRWPTFVLRYAFPLRFVSFLCLFLLIVFIIYQARDSFVQNFFNLVAAASIFILLSMVAGYLLGWIFRLSRQDRFTVISEMGTRNLAISTTVAVTVLSRPEFAVFGTAYFVIEVPLLLVAVAVYRRRSPVSSAV